MGLVGLNPRRQGCFPSGGSGAESVLHLFQGLEAALIPSPAAFYHLQVKNDFTLTLASIFTSPLSPASPPFPLNTFVNMLGLPG